MSRRRKARGQITFRTFYEGEDVVPTARAANGALLRLHSAKLHPTDKAAVVATYRA